MERRLQMLRPAEMLDLQAQAAIAYLPIGPIEWHGPHLPLGTDPLQAEALALALAGRTGGVVHPPLYWGTDQPHGPELLRDLGFHGDERIVGMNFPCVTVPSFYAAEEHLALVVRWTLEYLVACGFKLVVIVNGHLAANQIAILRRLAAEFSIRGPAAVLVVMGAEYALNGGDHACVTETSAILDIAAGRVDLTALPPRGQPLRLPDLAIADGASFSGAPTPDHTIPDAADPRRATAEIGRRDLEAATAALAALIDAAWQKRSRRHQPSSHT